MKRSLIALLLCALMLCAAPAFAETQWFADIDSHWTVNDAGEQQDLAAHDIGEGYCSVCGTEVFTFDDGSTWVTMYNEMGDQILFMTYDAAGNLETYGRCEITYDEEGYWLNRKEYDFGQLRCETAYLTITSQFETSTYPLQMTMYHDDGTREVTTYDESGWETGRILYDGAGEIIREQTIVYEFNENGDMTRCATYEGETVVDETLYEFDANGDPVSQMLYTDGRLVEEMYYSLIETEDYSYSYISRIVEHGADGSRIETKYDADGNVIE